jgi:hypothetical protein
MTPFRGNTRLLELHVTIVIMAIGIVAVSSAMATERQMLRRLHAGLKPVVTTPAITPDDQPLANARD